MSEITAILFIISLTFFGTIEITKSIVKKDYCKHIHDKHIDVTKCQEEPFPWKGSSDE